MGTIRIKRGLGDPVIFTSDSDVTTEEKKRCIERAERNALLADSDSMMVADRGLTDAKKTEWVTYRKGLRDMDFSDLDNLKWPTKPE